MTTKPDDDRMRIGGAWYEDGSWWVKRSRVVAALIAEGGEIVEALDATGWIEDWVVEVKQPGHYLMFRVPEVEEST